MITLASSIVVGLVLTVCDDNTNQCEVYVPVTYETKTIELGKELCRSDFRKYTNDAMQDDKYYALDAECKIIQPVNTKG